MLYIIWAVFNAIALGLFLWLAYKAVGMVRKQFGWAASIVLIAGLLSFINAPKDKKEENMVFLQPSSQRQGNNLNQVRHSTVLKKYGLFVLHLDVISNMQPDGKGIQPAKAMAEQYGFVMAHKWQLSNAAVYYNAGSKTINYNVQGTIKWKLLGIPFYAQGQTFKGTLPAP